MNQDKFTIQLDAKAENFAAVAESVRELGTALKGAAPDLDALKRALEGLSDVARVSATLAETAKTAGKLTDEFVRMDRATRDVRRGVGDLDEELNGARITAGSLADAMGRLRVGSVRLEDALDSSSDAADDTASSFRAASAGIDDLARSADRAEEQLDELGEQAKRTDAETRNVGDAGAAAGGGMQMAAVAGAAAAGAMAGLAIAMEAVKAGFEFAKGAVGEYMATTRQGQRDIAVFSFNVQELKNAIGQSVTESDLFRDGFNGLVGAVDDLTVVIPPLVETLDNYYTAASAAWEATEGFRDGVRIASEFLNNYVNPLRATTDAITFIGGVAVDAANAFEQWGGELRETEHALENQVAIVPDLTSVWTDASAAISSARNATGTFAEQWNSLREMLFGDSGEVEITPVASSGGGGGARDEAAEEQRQKALEQIEELKAANLESMARVAEIEENDRLKTLAGIEQEKQARLDLIEETEAAREAAREAAAEAAQAQAEQEAALLAERKAEIAGYTDFAKQGYADVTASLANSIATSELAFGKSSKSASKALGDSLIGVGQAAKAAAVIKGIGDPSTGFFPNPVGAAAMFVAGTAAVNLGRLFGGGKEDSIAAPREIQDEAPQAQNRTSNNYFNFPNSFVGNNDQLARTIASVMNQGRRNGVE